MKSHLALASLIVLAVIASLVFGQTPIHSFVSTISGSADAPKVRRVDDAPGSILPSSQTLPSENADSKTNLNNSNSIPVWDIAGDPAPSPQSNAVTPNTPTANPLNTTTTANSNTLNLTPSASSQTSANAVTDIALVPTQPANATPVAATQTTFFDSRGLFVYVPPDAAKRQTLRVIVALHGMGGQGEAFAASLVSAADKNGWILIAPTITYQNYLDTTLLAQDDLNYSRELLATLDLLPKKFAGLHMNRRASLYGFSRGAQLAHRFALMYPDHVLSLAAMSAGAYTLPYENRAQDGKTARLPFPFGLADLQQRIGRAPNYIALKQVKFFIAVGGNDTRASDVAAAFDPYIGRTRVERATAFANALKSLGIDARLVIIPSTGHEFTTEMQSDAVNFLRETDVRAPTGD